MISLDTNILVRYLTRDDLKQYNQVLSLLSQKGETFLVLDIVWIETCWVLTAMYDWEPQEAASAFEKLLSINNLEVENEDRLWKAIQLVYQGGDLPDGLIAEQSRSYRCHLVSSFDKSFAKKFPEFVQAS